MYTLTNTSRLLSAPKSTLLTKALVATHQSISTTAREAYALSVTEVTTLTSTVLDCPYIYASPGYEREVLYFRR